MVGPRINRASWAPRNHRETEGESGKSDRKPDGFGLNQLLMAEARSRYVKTIRGPGCASPNTGRGAISPAYGREFCFLSLSRQGKSPFLILRSQDDRAARAVDQVIKLATGSATKSGLPSGKFCEQISTYQLYPNAEMSLLTEGIILRKDCHER
jgi:hypothetical protein